MAPAGSMEDEMRAAAQRLPNPDVAIVNQVGMGIHRIDFSDVKGGSTSAN